MSAEFKVGSFVKRSGAGTQAIAGVGFKPKALVLWSSGATADATWQNNNRIMLGVSSGPGSSWATSGAILNSGSSVTASRRHAPRALTYANPNQSLEFDADLDSFDPDGFTLDWSSSTYQPIVGYLAIGGTGVEAAVGQLQTPASPGSFSVTGVGFTPDALIMLPLPNQSTGPVTGASYNNGIGVATHRGQWATHAGDNYQGLGEGLRSQRTDRLYVTQDNQAKTIFRAGSLTSLDADGFTLNADTAPSSIYFPWLALRGVYAHAGYFDKKNDGTGNQSVSGVGFEPSAVLMASFNRTASTAAEDHARWMIGAGDGDSNVVAVGRTTRGARDSRSIIQTSAIAYKTDTNADTTQALATLGSLDDDGFTLSWSTNDGVASQMLYLALGPVPSWGGGI